MGKSTAPHELRQTTRPDFESGEDGITVVDLFAGCGGLSLGIAQAVAAFGMATDVRLAIDFDEAATSVYSDNFEKAEIKTASVEEYFDGELGAQLTAVEKRTSEATGDVYLLVGGPPCQGHSDLNNHTRRDDPKNALYARMARAAEVLQPEFVLIENVPTVRHDISGIVGITRRHLESKDYTVGEATVSLHALGVAQRRRRHILLASRRGDVDPSALLEALVKKDPDAKRDLRWAIGDLEQVENPAGYDVPPRASDVNLQRMQYLLDHDLYDLPNSERPKCHQDQHSYKAMYGRLRWDLPAQTITSGFGSIGQGRYMHPSRKRALTPHEAARLQGFPDYFDFSAATRRADLATMIGNAVPPPLGREIASALLELTAGSASSKTRASG